MSFVLLLASALLVAIDPPAPSPAPVSTSDDRAAATEALESIIKAYRDPRGVQVEVEVTVGAKSDLAEGKSPSVKGTLLAGDKRRAVVALRGYQLRLSGGRIVATHDSNPLAYLDVSDNGSPFYALFNAFQALPIPELALALGEDPADEVCMQLMPQLSDVLPLRVSDDEIDGQACKVLVLESDDASQQVKLYFDPDTKLVERTVGSKKSGPEVQDGAEMTWSVASKASRPKDAPTDATFVLDCSGKQKVDGLAALISRDPNAAEDREVEGLKAGEPAPALTLPKVGGGDWDLVAARPKPVVIDFWATWCGPCVGSLPALERLAKEFEGTVEVMMVNSGEQGAREEREGRIRKVYADRKVPSLRCVLDMDGQAARRWLVRAFPTTFVIAPDGKIAGVWVGASPQSEREIKAKLAELLGVEHGAAQAPSPGPDPTPSAPK